MTVHIVVKKLKYCTEHFLLSSTQKITTIQTEGWDLAAVISTRSIRTVNSAEQHILTHQWSQSAIAVRHDISCMALEPFRAALRRRQLVETATLQPGARSWWWWWWWLRYAAAAGKH